LDRKTNARSLLWAPAATNVLNHNAATLGPLWVGVAARRRVVLMASIRRRVALPLTCILLGTLICATPLESQQKSLAFVHGFRPNRSLRLFYELFTPVLQAAVSNQSGCPHM